MYVYFSPTPPHRYVPIISYRFIPST